MRLSLVRCIEGQYVKAKIDDEDIQKVPKFPACAFRTMLIFFKMAATKAFKRPISMSLLI